MQKEKSIIIIDKLIAIGLYIVVSLMPIFFLPFNSDLLETNKQFLLVFLSILMLVLWLAKIVIQSKLSFTNNFLNIFVLLFLAAYFIASIFSKDKYQSFIGFGSAAAESFITILALGVLYFIVINAAERIKFIKRLVLILILSTSVAAAIAILQLLNIFPFAFWAITKAVAFNTVGTHNALAILNGLAVILAVACLFNRNIDFRIKIALATLSAALLFFTAFLKFWNVLIALIIAMAIYLIFTIFRREENLSRLLLIPMIIFGLSLVFYFTLIQPFSKNQQLAAQPFFKNLPTEILPSSKLTMDITKGALKDNLFLGSGPATWVFDYNAYKPKEVNRVADLWNIRFNKGWSYAFMLPATIGLVGSLFWMLIILVFFIYSLRNVIRLKEIQNSFGSLSLGLFTAWVYLVILQFLYPMNFVLQFVFWLIMALFIALSTIKSTKDGELKKQFKIEYRPNSPLASIISFVFVVIVVLALIGLYFLGQFYYADIYYNRGINAINSKTNLQSNIDLLEKSIFLNPHSDIYYRSLSQAYWLLIQEQAKKISPKDQSQTKQIQFLIDKMLSIAKKATELSPKNVENWIQRAQIYQGLFGFVGGSEDWTIKSYEEAIKLDPKNPYLYTELSRTYALIAIGAPASDTAKKEDQFKKAEDKINEALILKPDYSQAYILLALIYEQEGRVDEAISRLESASAVLDSDPNALFQLGYLYMKQDKTDQAQLKFEQAVKLVDSFSNARYFLGLIYDQKDMKDKAIEQFEKILTLNQNNQEVKQILKNLKNNLPALQGIKSSAPSPSL